MSRPAWRQAGLGSATQRARLSHQVGHVGAQDDQRNLIYTPAELHRAAALGVSDQLEPAQYECARQRHQDAWRRQAARFCVFMICKG